MELILLGLIAGVAVASYAVARRAARPTPPERQLPARAPRDLTPTSLRVNDIVQHLGTDWIVEGVISLSEDGRGSRLCALSDGTRTRFLFASRGEPDPAFLDARPDVRVEGQPETVHAAGQVFRLSLRGNVASERAGAILPERAGQLRVNFASYLAGQHRLLLLRWQDVDDVLVGERVAVSMLELLPGA